MVSQEWHWEQAIKYAVESIKTSLLLNGAAAIAVMTFANTRKFSGALHTPLILFAVGAMLSAFAFTTAYLCQLAYGNAEQPGIDVAQRSDLEEWPALEQGRDDYRVPQRVGVSRGDHIDGGRLA
jgi:hypothetical protein